jgi:hypothetical protein
MGGPLVINPSPATPGLNYRLLNLAELSLHAYPCLYMGFAHIKTGVVIVFKGGNRDNKKKV